MAPWPQIIVRMPVSATASAKPDQPQVENRAATITALSVLGVYVLLLLITGICLLVQFIARRSQRAKPTPAYLRSHGSHIAPTGRPVSTASNASFLAQGTHRHSGAEMGIRGAVRDHRMSPPPRIEVYVESPERKARLSALGTETALIPMQAKTVGRPNVLRHEESEYSLRDAARYSDSDSDSETVKGRDTESLGGSSVSTRELFYPEDYEDRSRP